MLESTLESEGGRALLGQAPQELALRVCGGLRDGHVVRLTAPRCSVGSSDRCTLRLRGPGIRPLHCVILRGAERTVVRRWSPDTLLNGRDFADAELQTGDQITIGPILFEVVPAGSVSSPTSGLRDSTRDVLTEEHSDSQRAQQRGLEELERRRAELDARHAELERRQRALAEEQERFRAECDAARQAHTGAQEQLDGQRARLETERASFRRQCEDETAQQARRAAELDGQANELAARARRLDQRETEIDSRAEAGEQGRAAGQDSYTTAADAIYAGVVEPAESADLRFEPVSDEAPLSAAAVMKRFGADVPAGDEGDSIGEAADDDDRRGAFQPAALDYDPDKPSPAPAGADDEDESIHDYMTRLMERVGGKYAAQAPATTTQRSTIERPMTPKPAASPSIRPATPPVEQRPKLQKLERRSAPELSADLSRMRALANENARTVLDDHFRRKLYYMTIGKASVAVAALFAGLLLLWWSTHGTPIAFYLSTISFAIAAIWMLQYAIAVGYLVRGRSKSDGTSRRDGTAAAKPKRAAKGTIAGAPPSEKPVDAAQSLPAEAAPTVESSGAASSTAAAECKLEETLVMVERADGSPPV